MDCAKKAIKLFEPEVLDLMNQGMQHDHVLIDKAQVLMIAYFNYS